MLADRLQYSLPRWRLTRWLADAGPSVRDDIRGALIGDLYGSLPVFVAGAMNTVVVATAVAMRKPTPPFIALVLLECAICVARVIILIVANRNARAHRETPTDLHILLSIAWSASVGLGAFLGLANRDLVIVSLTCVSAAAMVGGICFRHFSAPRIAGTMILLSLGPIVPGVLLSEEPLLLVACMQVPIYMLAMTAAAFRLNKMLVAVMHSERESDHLARHDLLTGLRNRAGFVDALEKKLAEGRGDQSFALMFIDLDNFKPVNDTFGHAAGDRLLTMVAERLHRLLPAGDVIARMGGDEFLALINGVTADQAIAIANRIIETATKPYALGETQVRIGVSIGIAVSPQHGTDPELLLTIADAALYEAKSQGKSCCRLAGAEPDLAALRRLGADARKSVKTGAAA
jgi:diguanylate cyclase (GGDEF)-like protein